MYAHLNNFKIWDRAGKGSYNRNRVSKNQAVITPRQRFGRIEAKDGIPSNSHACRHFAEEVVFSSGSSQADMLEDLNTAYIE